MVERARGERERERKRERVRAMTQPSFAVGIVVSVVSVRVRRAKEQVGCDGGGRGEPEGCETTERGSWRKGGKRRKQKAIAYERQLAPLMARETKQKSEASSSNTIKPTVCAPFVRASRKEEEEDEKEEK